MNYVCTALDGMTCTAWAQANSFLPPMSIEDGAAIAALYIGCWFTALGVRMVVRRLQNRSA